MTTVTDDGLEFITDRLIGDSTEDLDTIALGTGSNESTTSTSLGNQEYSASKSSDNVTLIDTGTAGEREFAITVQGGTELPAGTQITEIGLITSGGTLVVIDEFTSIELETGRTEEFVVPLDPQR